jgi:hypothetical protein
MIAEMQSSSLLYVSEAGKGLPVVSGALAQAAPISGTAQRIPPYLGRQLTSKRARMRPRWIAPLESTGCFYGVFFFAAFRFRHPFSSFPRRVFDTCKHLNSWTLNPFNARQHRSSHPPSQNRTPRNLIPCVHQFLLSFRSCVQVSLE